jgi:hypothetical protein
MFDFVTLSKAAENTGYTEKALRRKIEDGILAEGRHWKRGPDGRILIIVEGFNKWLASPPSP